MLKHEKKQVNCLMKYQEEDKYLKDFAKHISIFLEKILYWKQGRP